MIYEEMSIEEVVNYINSELLKGRTMKEIEIYDFGVNERVIAKRLSRKNIKKIDGQFVLQSGGHTVLSKENTEIEVVRDIDVLHKEDSVVPNELKENLKNLMSNYNVLMEMIESYKNNGVVQEGDIVVQLPKERNTLFKTSVRLNDVVYEEFKEFCSKHKTFTQKELHSMALLEYIKKYDK